MSDASKVTWLILFAAVGGFLLLLYFLPTCVVAFGHPVTAESCPCKGLPMTIYDRRAVHGDYGAKCLGISSYPAASKPATAVTP